MLRAFGGGGVHADGYFRNYLPDEIDPPIIFNCPRLLYSRLSCPPDGRTRPVGRNNNEDLGRGGMGRVTKIITGARVKY